MIVSRLASAVGKEAHANVRGFSARSLFYQTSPASAVVERARGGEQFVANIPLEPVAALHIHVVSPENPTDRVPFQVLQLQSRPFPALPMYVSAELRPLTSGEIEITGLVPGRYLVDFTHSGIAASGELRLYPVVKRSFST